MDDITCDCCKQAYNEEVRVISVLQIGNKLLVYYYCSRHCYYNHKLVLIREAGL